jgi:hypothetical protein
MTATRTSTRTSVTTTGRSHVSTSFSLPETTLTWTVSLRAANCRGYRCPRKVRSLAAEPRHARGQSIFTYLTWPMRYVYFPNYLKIRYLDDL